MAQEACELYSTLEEKLALLESKGTFLKSKRIQDLRTTLAPIIDTLTKFHCNYKGTVNKTDAKQLVTNVKIHDPIEF